MVVLLEKLHRNDREGLFEFERENRFYFEKMVPKRGDTYYDAANFKERFNALLDEQAAGNSYFYLIKNQAGTILGRMNLIDIDQAQNLGHVGYRVGEKYSGKGIAYGGLQLLLDIANEIGIEKLKAKTTNNNIASQKVLEKSGFTQTATASDEFEMLGKRLKFVYYSWSNQKSDAHVE